MSTWQQWQQLQTSSGSGKTPPPGFYPRDAPYPRTLDNTPDYFGSVRRNSISFSNIHSILMCQLLITLSSIAIVTLHDTTNLYIKSLQNLNLFVFIIIPSTFYILTKCKKEQRKRPINLIILFIFIFAESILLSESVAIKYPEHVYLVLKLITLISFGLILFAIHSKIKFIVLNGFVILTIIVVLVVTFISTFFPRKLIALIIVRDLLVNGCNNIFIITYFLHPSDSWW